MVSFMPVPLDTLKTHLLSFFFTAVMNIDCCMPVYISKTDEIFYVYPFVQLILQQF